MASGDTTPRTQHLRGSGAVTPRCYFVTGASSGVGLAIVRLLAADGHTVIGAGSRSPQALPSEFPDVAYHQADLSGPVQPVVNLARSSDRVILAAGTGFYRPLEEENPTDVESTLAVNFASIVALLHGLYPSLLARAGRVALLGSIAAKGSAGMPVYSATKGALEGLARSLASEWADRIVVRHFRLWPTRTPMHQRAGYDANKIDWLLMNPDSVARLVVDRLKNNGPANVTVSPLSVLGRK